VSRERAVAEISATRCASGTAGLGVQHGVGPSTPEMFEEAMHHFHGPVRTAAGGRAQGSRIRDGVFAVLAVWIGLSALQNGDPRVYVHALFRDGAGAGSSFGAFLPLGATVELMPAQRGGLRFDEGDAERQVSRERAVAEISATRCASGTVPFLSARGSWSDSLRSRNG
jgi:hypothetical protein